MLLPISFDEVSYFKNEYRGDLIVTEGVLYYFPHTRVSYARRETGFKGMIAAKHASIIAVLVLVVPYAGWIFEASDKSVKIGKFLKRTFRPSVNRALIKKEHVWHGNEDSKLLQRKLDAYIADKKSESLKFDEDSVPKPMRFAIGEMEKVRLGLKLKFDSKFDDHDFRINPIRRGLLKRALKEGGFLS